MSLEQKGFVATVEDVASVVESVLTANAEADAGRLSYLKILIATTQNELGGKPRIRASSGPGKAAKLKGEDIAIQLKALAAVNDRFYPVVTRVVVASIAPGTKDKGLEANRRTNFARTALSAVRLFIAAGNDITAVGLKTVTKASLAVRRPPKPPSGQRLKARAEAQSKTLVATLMELADADKSAAVEELQLLMGQVATQLVALGVAATKDAAQAMSEHRPYRIGKMLFAPTDTQLVRQQARPS